MRKLLILLVHLFAVSATNAQSLAVFKTNNAWTPTLTILNGAFINETTSPLTTNTVKILFKNTSSVTHTYTVYRTILFNNPPLDVSCSSTVPQTYFAFGFSAFPDCVNTPPSSDWTVLGPAGSTSFPFDGNYANGNPFLIDLDEASSMGQYHVKYTLMNVVNANDTLAFTIRYNFALGTKESGQLTETATIYPNPSNGNFTVKGLATGMIVEIYNSIGQSVIRTESVSNKADINNLPDGLYFVKVIENGKCIGIKKLICE